MADEPILDYGVTPKRGNRAAAFWCVICGIAGIPVGMACAGIIMHVFDVFGAVIPLIWAAVLVPTSVVVFLGTKSIKSDRIWPALVGFAATLFWIIILLLL